MGNFQMAVSVGEFAGVQQLRVQLHEASWALGSISKAWVILGNPFLAAQWIKVGTSGSEIVDLNDPFQL